MAHKNTLPSLHTLAPITHKRRSLRVAWVLFGAALTFAIAYGLLWLWVLREWQLVIVAGLLTAFSVVVLVSVGLIRQEKLNVAIWLIIMAMWVIFPTSALIKGLGFILGLGLPLITLAVATQTLPAKQTNRAVIVSIVVGALTFLLGSFPLEYQLTVPVDFDAFITIMAAVVLLIFGAFIVGQFSNYSLRVKFIITFLVLSLFSLGAGAYFANRTITTTLTENAGINLARVADSQAQGVDDLLTVQLDILKSLSLSRNIRDRLLLANTGYGTNPTQIRDELQKLDQEWKNTESADMLVQTRLNNAIATELLVFQKAFPRHAEIFVTDKHGGLLAATNKTSDYYQADEDWWQATYDNGQGATYVSQPVFDESSDTLGLEIALPITDDDGTVIGILRTTYNLSVLANVLAEAQFGQTGRVDIYLPDGQEIEAEHGKFEFQPAGLDLIF